jgi:hypothetical protein
MAAEPVASGTGPKVAITSPSKNDVVSGKVDITAQVTSSTDVSSVKVKIDDGTFTPMTKSGSDYKYTWDATDAAEGIHKISVQASDVFSKTSTASISVKIESTVPTVGITIDNIRNLPTSPTDLDKITVTCTVTSDDATISEVKIQYCEDDICQIPTPMDATGDNKYTYTMGPFKAGAKISYDIIVKDSNGKTKTSAETYITIASSGTGPVTTDDDVVNNNSNTPGFEAVGLMMMLAVTLIAFYVFRRKDRST